MPLISPHKYDSDDASAKLTKKVPTVITLETVFITTVNESSIAFALASADN
jgi:hypothetical protein